MAELVFRQDETVARLCAGKSVEALAVGKSWRKWTWSRTVIDREAKTAVSLLVLLAHYKFPEWDEKTQVPYWVDRDPTNEVMENVALMTKPKTRAPSKLGLPAGSLEYNREYRKRNKDKLNLYYRQRYKKQRAELHAMREQLKDPTSPTAQYFNFLEKSSQDLAEILEMAKAEGIIKPEEK